MCEKVFRQPPLRDSLKRGRLRKQDFAISKQKTALLVAADSIGKKIQYDCPGFLPNRRQVIDFEGKNLVFVLLPVSCTLFSCFQLKFCFSQFKGYFYVLFSNGI